MEIDSVSKSCRNKTKIKKKRSGKKLCTLIFDKTYLFCIVLKKKGLLLLDTIPKICKSKQKKGRGREGDYCTLVFEKNSKNNICNKYLFPDVLPCFDFLSFYPGPRIRCSRISRTCASTRFLQQSRLSKIFRPADLQSK